MDHSRASQPIKTGLFHLQPIDGRGWIPSSQSVLNCSSSSSQQETPASRIQSVVGSCPQLANQLAGQSWLVASTPHPTLALSACGLSPASAPHNCSPFFSRWPLSRDLRSEAQGHLPALGLTSPSQGLKPGVGAPLSCRAPLAGLSRIWVYPTRVWKRGRAVRGGGVQPG